MKHELTEFEGNIIGECPHCGEHLTGVSCEEECPARKEEVPAKCVMLLSMETTKHNTKLIDPEDVTEIAFSTSGVMKNLQLHVCFKTKLSLPERWPELHAAFQSSTECTVALSVEEQGSTARYILKGYLRAYNLASYSAEHGSRPEHIILFEATSFHPEKGIE